MIILGSDQENKLLAKGGNYMELSIQIKKYRTELHLSQEELAEKVYVTRQTISNWENEKSYPDIHSLLLLSSLFNVSLDQLIKGDIEKMKEIIAEQLSVDADSITEASSFKDDLGADSLDLFELVMALEDEYNIEIPAEDLTDLTTVGAVMDYLKNKGVEA
jgi:acyl carrier protein